MSTPMNDDELLGELGQLVRDVEQDPDMQAFEAWVHGRLPASQLVQLRDRAGHDSDLEQALRAYAPLDASTQSRIAENLSAALAHRLAVNVPPARVATAAKVVAPLAPARPTFVWHLPVFAAAAVALIWFVATPRRPLELPGYELSLSGANAEFRSGARVTTASPSSPLRIGSTSRLTVRLRPNSPVAGTIAARAYWASANTSKPWPARSTVSDQGAVQLELSPLPAGIAQQAPLRLVVVVGEPAELERLDIVRMESSASRGRGWQRWELLLQP